MFSKIHQAAQQIGEVLVGKHLQIRQTLACVLAGGHLLIEDVPGVGKTTLAHALAISLGLQWKRQQFTSDLLPADVAGMSVYDRGSASFVFHPGPCSRKCCWPTRSTAPRRRRNRACSKRWKSGK